MKFLDLVNETCGTTNLYEVLGVSKDAKESEIKRAYHKLSLKVHPDRVELDKIEEATAKFQVQKCNMDILSDGNKRGIYDETGCIPDDDSNDDNTNWVDIWKLMFKSVTLEDVKKFEEKYKGSTEEMEDLKSAYIDYEGDMDKIMESVLCAQIDDEPRYRGMIANWIAEGSVPSFNSFVNETVKKRKKRKRAHEREAEEAEAMKKELGMKDGEEGLKMLIKARNEERDVNNFFDQLAEKYAPKQKKPKTQKLTAKKDIYKKKGKKK